MKGLNDQPVPGSSLCISPVAQVFRIYHRRGFDAGDGHRRKTTSPPVSYAEQFGIEAPSWPLDVLAVQCAPMHQLRTKTVLAEEKEMKRVRFFCNEGEAKVPRNTEVAKIEVSRVPVHGPCGAPFERTACWQACAAVSNSSNLRSVWSPLNSGSESRLE